jgi:uncharacterized delta-60 repeat protein
MLHSSRLLALAVSIGIVAFVGCSSDDDDPPASAGPGVDGGATTADGAPVGEGGGGGPDGGAAPVVCAKTLRLDATYGNGGVVRPLAPYSGGDAADTFSVAAGDGAVAVSGRPVRRLLPNGTVDPAFAATVEGIALPGGDGVVVVHSRTVAAGAGQTIPAVTRLDRTGMPVASFGAAGEARLDAVVGASGRGEVELGEIAPDGKIVVAGTLGGSTKTGWFVARLTAGGVLDPELAGGKGFVTRTGGNQITGLAVHPDGAITVGIAGDLGDPQRRFAIVRLAPNGEPDARFGKDGTKASLAFDETRSLHLEGSGSILTAAVTEGTWRVLPDGSFDWTFADHGYLESGSSGLPLPEGGKLFYLRGLVTFPSGELMGLGAAGTETGARSLLARFTRDGHPCGAPLVLDDVLPDLQSVGRLVRDDQGRVYASGYAKDPAAPNGNVRILARFILE